MGWKNWSDWIKGSIISLIIITLCFILVGFMGLSINEVIFIRWFYEYPSNFVQSVFCGPPGLESLGCAIKTAITLVPLLTILYSIIIGAIYDLIKNGGIKNDRRR